MVKKLKPGKCGQTAGLIGTNFGALMQIHLERVVGPTKLAGGGGIGVRGSEIKKSEKAHGQFVVTDVQFRHLFLVYIKYVALPEVTCG